MMFRRRIVATIFHLLSLLSAAGLVALLVYILWVIIKNGWSTLNWALISQTPHGGFYLGGGGGIANAIVGSLYLGLCATAAAAVISIPTVLYLHVYASDRFASAIRWLLDVLWGVPSIVFGAFGFALMVAFKLHASLLAGIITVALFELPIMIRAIDEVVKMVPHELSEASYSVGSTRFETAYRVIFRQALPGMITGGLLAFGRGIGDAASVLFTAGFTDRIPHSIFEPAATLPLSVFFLMGSPFPEVQQRAYGAAVVLVLLVLSTSLLARLLSLRFSRYTES